MPEPKPQSVPVVHVNRMIAQAVMPEQAYSGDAGFDLTAMENVEIAPLGRARVRTGLALEMPDDVYAMIVPRSGLAVQHGVTVLNAPGIVDSSYQGEIRIVLFNADATQPFRVKIGNRVAQIVFCNRLNLVMEDIPYPRSPTARGHAGFGSSGV